MPEIFHLNQSEINAYGTTLLADYYVPGTISNNQNKNAVSTKHLYKMDIRHGILIVLED